MSEQQTNCSETTTLRREDVSVGDTVRRRPCGRGCIVTAVNRHGAKVRDGAWHGWILWETIAKKWRK